jgi:hypothetical protein
MEWPSTCTTSKSLNSMTTRRVSLKRFLASRKNSNYSAEHYCTNRRRHKSIIGAKSAVRSEVPSYCRFLDLVVFLVDYDDMIQMLQKAKKSKEASVRVLPVPSSS